MRRLNVTVFIVFLIIALVVPRQIYAWRSALYPISWTPGYSLSQDTYLQDYSYAGYHMGENGVPGIPNSNQLPKPIYNVVTQYGAKNDGSVNASTAIQKAIDAASANGQGTVYLPAGTYLINTPFLRINSSNVVLKGDGPDKTKVYTTDEDLRWRNIIRVGPAGGSNSTTYWYKSDDQSTKIDIAQDYLLPTQEIKLKSVAGLKVGDWIIVINPATEQFRQEHDSEISWAKSEKGPTFFRQITSINTTTNTIAIDILIRYKLLTRDGANIYKVSTPTIQEVGIQDLSFGIRQSHLPVGANYVAQDADGSTVGHAGYSVQGSKLVLMQNVVNGWIANISTFRPAENDYSTGRDLRVYPKYPHIASKGITLDESRNVTIYNTTIGTPSFRGGGGNGYLYDISASDNLLFQVKANNGRHNFLFTNMRTSGNVVLDSNTHQDLPSDKAGFEYKSGIHSDLHGRMPIANLFDNMTFDNDTYYAYYMIGSNAKGQNSTQTTFWNSHGMHASRRTDFLNYGSDIIWSTQYGQGYIIGTDYIGSGDTPQCTVKTTPYLFKDYRSNYGSTPVPPTEDAFFVDTSPEDYKEGICTGKGLEPRSLYLDQLKRRLDDQPIPTNTPPKTPTPTLKTTSTPTLTPTVTSAPTTTPTSTPAQSDTPTPSSCDKSYDLDDSGLVDLSDVSILISALGQTGSGLPEDLNCDQIVDLSDFSLLITKLGE